MGRCHKGRLKKKLDKLGLLAEVGGGGVGGGLKGPTCYMVYSLSLEHAKKHFQTMQQGLSLGWGEGSAEVQPKAQVCPVFFMKPSLIKKVENLVTISQIVCIGGLSPSICSQIQKCLKLI